MVYHLTMNGRPLLTAMTFIRRQRDAIEGVARVLALAREMIARAEDWP